MSEIDELIEEIEKTESAIINTSHQAKYELKIRLLTLTRQVNELARIIQSLDKTVYQASNTASCLANGIIPD